MPTTDEWLKNVGIPVGTVDPNYVSPGATPGGLPAGTVTTNRTKTGTANAVTRAPTPAYTNPYQSQINTLAGQLSQEIAAPVSQDVTQHPYYIAAKARLEREAKDASSLVRQQNAAQNRVHSSYTDDALNKVAQNLVQVLQTEIAPQAYKSMQDERQSRIGNLMNQLNVIQSLASMDAQSQQMVWNQAMQQMQYDWQVNQAKDAAAKQRIQDAWDRVKNLGYVDNTASIILGIPAGTLSADAQRYDADRKSREKIAAQQNAVQWANVNKPPAPREYSPQETFENNIMAKLQSGQPLTPQEQQYATNKGWIGTKQTDIVAEAVKLAQNDPAFEDASEQERAEIIQRYVNMVKKLRGQSAPLPAARADTYLGVTDGMTDEEIYRVFGQ